MSDTTIEFCNCKNEFQDKRYGNQKRLHNVGVSKTPPPPRRCTVCGTRKTN